MKYIFYTILIFMGYLVLSYVNPLIMLGVALVMIAHILWSSIEIKKERT